MRFVGIDCSSFHIHLVLLNGRGDLEKKTPFLKWESKSKNTDERFYEITEAFKNWVDGLEGEFVFVIEKPIYVQSFPATSSLSKVIGVVQFILKSHFNERPYMVDNKSWKKLIGSGNASKELIAQFAKQKWGDVFTEQDWCDAAVIALWGVQQLGKEG